MIIMNKQAILQVSEAIMHQKLITYTTYTNVLVYYTVFNLQQIDKLIEFSS